QWRNPADRSARPRRLKSKLKIIRRGQAPADSTMPCSCMIPPQRFPPLAVLIFIGMAVTVFLTSLLSGIFGMAGGLILLWVLLFLFPVGPAIAIHGVIQAVANGSRAWFSRAY